LRISASMTGSGFIPGNVMVIGCLMRRPPPLCDARNALD
jgi:hypothetical protein